MQPATPHVRQAPSSPPRAWNMLLVGLGRRWGLITVTPGVSVLADPTGLDSRSAASKRGQEIREAALRKSWQMADV